MAGHVQVWQHTLFFNLAWHHPGLLDHEYQPRYPLPHDPCSILLQVRATATAALGSIAAALLDLEPYPQVRPWALPLCLMHLLLAL